MTSGKTAPAVHEIVRVEIDAMRLYAEVIQVIEPRVGQRLISEGYAPTDGHRLWVRPLCICEADLAQMGAGEFQLGQVFDLRGGADLVWPADVFHQVLDTEWIEILGHLNPDAPALGMLAIQEPSQAQIANQKLRQFLAAVRAA